VKSHQAKETKKGGAEPTRKEHKKVRKKKKSKAYVLCVKPTAAERIARQRETKYFSGKSKGKSRQKHQMAGTGEDPTGASKGVGNHQEGRTRVRCALAGTVEKYPIKITDKAQER